MQDYLKPLMLAAICVFLTSCITLVEVEKYKNNVSGVRYSLPATYLLVTPKSDGTASYDWVYLPDPENEYVVRTKSYMTKYTTDLTLENGLLKKVTSKSDSTGVATKTFDAAQSVYVARTTAAADAAKKEADKNDAAKKAIADARLELIQAKSELAVLEKNGKSGPSDADWLKATIKVEQAENKLAAAKSAAPSALNAMNAPGGENGLKTGQAWGPVLFRVVQDKETVKLVAVNKQQAFDTATAVKPPKPTITFKFPGDNIFPASAEKSLKFNVVANQEIASVNAAGIGITQDKPNGLPYAPKDKKFELNLNPQDKKTVSVEISPAPPQGKYIMSLPYKITTDGQETASEIKFEVK
jgi:hypothetical protein